MEVVVKSMKRALPYVIHRANLTDEELATALVHAESLVDRKPLTAIASDIGHLEHLTPHHFLIGHMSTSVTLECTDENTNNPHPHLRRRWQ